MLRFLLLAHLSLLVAAARDPLSASLLSKPPQLGAALRACEAARAAAAPQASPASAESTPPHSFRWPLRAPPLETVVLSLLRDAPDAGGVAACLVQLGALHPANLTDGGAALLFHALSQRKHVGLASALLTRSAPLSYRDPTSGATTLHALFDVRLLALNIAAKLLRGGSGLGRDPDREAILRTLRTLAASAEGGGGGQANERLSAALHRLMSVGSGGGGRGGGGGGGGSGGGGGGGGGGATLSGGDVQAAANAIALVVLRLARGADARAAEARGAGAGGELRDARWWRRALGARDGMGRSALHALAAAGSAEGLEEVLAAAAPRLAAAQGRAARAAEAEARLALGQAARAAEAAAEEAAEEARELGPLLRARDAAGLTPAAAACTRGHSHAAAALQAWLRRLGGAGGAGDAGAAAAALAADGSLHAVGAADGSAEGVWAGSPHAVGAPAGSAEGVCAHEHAALDAELPPLLPPGRVEREEAGARAEAGDGGWGAAPAWLPPAGAAAVAAAAARAASLPPCALPVLDAAALDAGAFYARFLRLSRPVLLRGFLRAGHPLRGAWSRAALLAAAGNASLQASRIPYERGTTTLPDASASTSSALALSLAEFAEALLHCGDPAAPPPAAPAPHAALCARLAAHAARTEGRGVAAGHGALPLYVFEAPEGARAAPDASAASGLAWAGPPEARALLQHVDPLPPLLRGRMRWQPVAAAAAASGAREPEAQSAAAPLAQEPAAGDPPSPGAPPEPPLLLAAPPKPQFFLGAAGTGAPPHFHKDALNLLVWGSKRWWLLPPSQALYSTVPAAAWVSSYLVERAAAVAGHPSGEPIAMECTQEPGDALYVPAGWGHATLNMETVVGVALEFEVHGGG